MRTMSVHDLADKMLEDYENGVHSCLMRIELFCGACDLSGHLSKLDRYKAAFNFSHVNAGLGPGSPYEALKYAEDKRKEHV